MKLLLALMMALPLFGCNRKPEVEWLPGATQGAYQPAPGSKEVPVGTPLGVPEKKARSVDTKGF